MVDLADHTFWGILTPLQVYGLRAFENGEGFTNAQCASSIVILAAMADFRFAAFLNIVENFMNIAYLYLAHISGSPVAPLIGFASVVMTFSKTVLYWLQEYYCGGCSVGHNDFVTLIVYWVIPNGCVEFDMHLSCLLTSSSASLWLVVPGFIMIQLGKDISASLHSTANANRKKASGKKQ